MPKILLIGHFGFTNLGCEAIVRGTTEIIRKQIPDAWITLISRRAEHDAEVCQRGGIGVNEIVPSAGKNRRFGLAWVAGQVARRLMRPSMAQYDYVHRQLYGTHDAVLCIGGDLLSDEQGSAGRWLESLARAKASGARTVIWAASIGPFRNPVQERKWAEMLKCVDLITVREELSVGYLNSLGLRTNVGYVADPAFIMQAQRPTRASGAAPLKRPLVGVGISDRYLLSPAYGRQYIEASGRFIQYVVRQVGGSVRLIPHVKGDLLAVSGGRGTAGHNRACEDDVLACEEVARAAGCGEAVRIEGLDYDAPEMKCAIGECDYFVGARTHSTIASLSLGVPTISVAFSVKAYGINRDLLGSEEFVMPADRLTFENLVDRFEQLRTKQEEIRCALRAAVPQLKDRARVGGELLAGLLKANRREGVVRSITCGMLTAPRRP